MWWHYLLVFAGALLVDVSPFPLPPAFTVMMILQITFDLNIWGVIAVGVTGSVAGRYILALYIPKLSGRIFKPAKNEDLQYLGKKMKEKGWKSHALILVYSLMPLPTTPLFIAGGMAKMKPYQIIPAFVLGKFISDTAAVLMGKQAVRSAGDLVHGLISWKSIAGLVLGLLLMCALLFIDWRALLQRKQLKLKFKIWR
jgi:membrane protein DedA with SNARE-associated domain